MAKTAFRFFRDSTALFSLQSLDFRDSTAFSACRCSKVLHCLLKLWIWESSSRCLSLRLPFFLGAQIRYCIESLLVQCPDHLAGGLPHVRAAMPVFELSGSQLSQENLATGTLFVCAGCSRTGRRSGCRSSHAASSRLATLDVIFLGVVGLHPDGLTDRT